MKRSSIEITERKDRLVKLVAGLLSSGHYSEIKTHEEYADGMWITEPRLLHYEVHCENWVSEYPRKHPFHVIDDAESLLRDIEFVVDQEAK